MFPIITAVIVHIFLLSPRITMRKISVARDGKTGTVDGMMKNEPTRSIFIEFTVVEDVTNGSWVGSPLMPSYTAKIHFITIFGSVLVCRDSNLYSFFQHRTAA